MKTRPLSEYKVYTHENKGCGVFSIYYKSELMQKLPTTDRKYMCQELTFRHCKSFQKDYE